MVTQPVRFCLLVNRTVFIGINFYGKAALAAFFV